MNIIRESKHSMTLPKDNCRRKKYRSLPDKYLAEYTERITRLTKSRVGLLCILVVALYLSATALSYAISPSEFNSNETPLALFFILAALALFIFNRKASAAIPVKVNAYLAVILSLAFMTCLCAIYKEYFNITGPIYLFMLFTISFTIPWRPKEVAVVTLLHMAAFSKLFMRLNSDMPPEIHAMLWQSYSDGMIMIFMGFILCYVLRREENALQIENYLLLKDVESKNAQMQRELELATRIHKTLIPRSINTDKADIAVLYLPMYYMGGDYAKFQFVDNEKLIFIIADVTGHGVSAALMVNRIHAEVERLIREGRSPGLLLNELNDLIVKQFEGINMFLSAFAGMLDFKSMKLIYSNHGHPAQYIYHIKDSVVARLSSQTALLGLSGSEKEACEHSINFDKGDRILLFTDGVIETRNKRDEFYGEDRLERFVRENYNLEVEQFNQRLLDDLNGFKKSDFEDDIFILNIHAKTGR